MINDLSFDILPEDQKFDHQGIPLVLSEESEFVHAKAFLQKRSPFSGDNLYDHLTDVLNKILAERPENVIDFFEEYSRKVKEKRFKPLTDHFEDMYVVPGRYQRSNKLLNVLRPMDKDAPSTTDPEDLELADMAQNNMLQLLYFFEHAGLGLPRAEMFALNMSMKKLIHAQPIASIRFWGKIFGLQKNYIIVETVLKEEEYMNINEKLQEENVVELQPASPTEDTNLALQDIEKRQELGGEGVSEIKLWTSLPPIPLVIYEPPPEPPSEPAGVGVNRKVYFVCHEVGDHWIRLPDVTPKQIRTARQIYQAFTGNLQQEVYTYPEFPGTEENYLRAQIARISSATHISPLGYYTFGDEVMGEDEEMDEEAEEGSKTEFRENPKYDPVAISDLIDNSMSFWVHHMPYILPQGRITWWNPNPLPEPLGEDVGEEEEEIGPQLGGAEPETGPALLTPCSEDVSLDAIPAWSVRISSRIASEYAIAVVRSNFWPGAYGFSTQGKLFQNIYFGFGMKYMSQNFSPTPLPAVEQEYPIGPDVMEMFDPTGAQEEEWRIAHLPKPPPPLELKGEDVGGEGEEEEEDEEDD